MPNIAPPAWPRMPDQRAGHRLGLLGQGAAHGADDVLGDRLDEPLPDLAGADSTHSARLQAAVEVTPEGNVGGLVEPVVGEPHGVGDRVLLALRGGGVGLLGDGASGDVTGQVPVHGAVVGLPSSPASGSSSAGQVGHPRPSPGEDLLERRALEGVVGLLARGCRSWDQTTRLLVDGLRSRVPCPTSLTGPSAVRLVDLRETPLDVAEVLAALDDDASGGLTLFVGTVRDHDGGQGVTGLEYSAHPTALDRLQEVCDAGRREYDVLGLAAVHRIGPLAIGDARGRRGHRGRPPGRGVRRLARPDRPPQGRGADLEAPAVHRRHRRVGRHALSRPRRERSTWRPCPRSGDPGVAGAPGRGDRAGHALGGLAGPQRPGRGRPRRRRRAARQGAAQGAPRSTRRSPADRPGPATAAPASPSARPAVTARGADKPALTDDQRSA